MFCGQCGKKVMDNMLFCPFCGAAIVIPDQDESEAVPLGPAELSKTNQSLQNEFPIPAAETSSGSEPDEGRLFDGDTFEETDCSLKEEFVPLSIGTIQPERTDDEESARSEAKPAQTNVIEDIPPRVESARIARRGAPQPNADRSKNTYIPVRNVGADDLFLDTPDAYDDYDSEETDEEGFGGASYEYVDREEGSFFSRHVRGIVGLALLAVVLVVLIFWSLSDAGQSTLGRMNLSKKATTYARLGYEAYNAGEKPEAAQYYEKAFARSDDNLEYAHSAVVAYYEAGDIESATDMLKKCIALNADDPELYNELLIFYPDAATRPWEITQIVRDGYARTGDERLNIQ